MWIDRIKSPCACFKGQFKYSLRLMAKGRASFGSWKYILSYWIKYCWTNMLGLSVELASLADKTITRWYIISGRSNKLLSMHSDWRGDCCISRYKFMIVEQHKKDLSRRRFPEQTEETSYQLCFEFASLLDYSSGLSLLLKDTFDSVQAAGEFHFYLENLFVAVPTRRLSQ